ncbi:MAG: anaerobic ribonucleoside-triphosphate reductase activating protein [Peptostreptococcaceae bacterium]|nr:anaerobic ribonucleoside-triphosphate reductase activating protein [Peptostreptococcaceae bacterium]
MIVNGLQKLSLLDYPGYTAATMFFSGCNFRCPYCHNSDLVLHPNRTEEITDEEIFEFLNKRKGLLDGICVTGGEPLLRSDLEPFLKEIKNMGFKVKLDTNGSLPKRLSELIESGILDYVAMDVKNSKEKYALTAGIPELIKDNVVEKINESINLLMEDRVDYEFRTTVTKELHNIEDMNGIGRWIKGSKRYFIQNFIDSGRTIKEGYTGQTKDWLDEAKEAVQQHVQEVDLRG